MAFKIKAAEQKRLEETANDLSAKRDALDDAVSVFNEALAAARAALQEKIDEYNTAAESIRAQLQDIQSERDEEFSDRSEKWQESANGEKVREWIDNFEQEQNRIEDVSLDDFPEELSFEELMSDGDDPVDVVNELVLDPLNDEE
jgi:chromosome segregation ATPase